MKRAAVGLLLPALVLPACGPPSLQGSLSVLMDMRYEGVEVVMGRSDLTVRYVKPTNAGDDVQYCLDPDPPVSIGCDLVLAVSARGLQLPFPDDARAPITFDLAEDFGAGQRGALARNVLNDPRQTFPAMERGHLTFNSVPVVGQRTNGDFAVTFILGEEFGNGRTLFDNFPAVGAAAANVRGVP